METRYIITFAVLFLTFNLVVQTYFLDYLKSGTHQTIVVYGTSLSASPEGWPSMLGKEIDKRYPSLINVENMAKGAV